VPTVETHRANMQEKLHLETRADLLAPTLRRGLLSLLQRPEPYES
jgi:DNA-binding CsgD family transcriptional regulator